MLKITMVKIISEKKTKKLNIRELDTKQSRRGANLMGSMPKVMFLEVMS